MVNTRVQEFGDCYKKKRDLDSQQHLSSEAELEVEDLSDSDDENDISDDLSNQVFERVCKRIKKSQALARLSGAVEVLPDHRKHLVPKSALCEPVKTEWRGSISFDTILFTFIQDEYYREREVERGLLQGHSCACEKCFDCVLVKELCNLCDQK